MEVTINGQAHEVPFDLKLIKLGEFIEYQRQYGDELDKEFTELQKKEYEAETGEIELLRLMDMEDYLDKEALAWFCFWTKSKLNAAKAHKGILPFLTAYRSLRYLLKSQADAATKDYPFEYNWNGELWEIEDFKLNPASEMTFNEVITSKETMRQLHSLGQGRWESLPYLAAIYFRKKGEAFEDNMVHEGSERMKVLTGLPLDAALGVAFFLTSCLSTWQKLLAYSATKEANRYPN